MTDVVIADTTIDKGKILAALGFNPADPKAQAALLICQRYGLDPVLKHVVLIERNPYITRDGYLHIAHESGVLDGITVVRQPKLEGDYWVATVAVYRKDMAHPFEYVGRFPYLTRKNTPHSFGPEMAVKCAEVAALRRAFNISGMGAADERWDTDESSTDIYTEPEQEAVRGKDIAPSYDRAKEDTGDPTVAAYEKASPERIGDLTRRLGETDLLNWAIAERDVRKTITHWPWSTDEADMIEAKILEVEHAREAALEEPF